MREVDEKAKLKKNAGCLVRGKKKIVGTESTCQLRAASV